MFQHFVNSALDDIANQITTEQCLSVEFENFVSCRILSVRFWKGDNLCRVFICRSGLPFPNLNGELGYLARLLSVVSTKAGILACSGFPADFLRTVDQSSIGALRKGGSILLPLQPSFSLLTYA